MIPIKKLNNLTASEKDALFNRFGDDFSDIMINTVVPIINDVKTRGDEAVLDYTEKFDGIRLDSVVASREEIEAGYRATPAEVRDAFDEARRNVEEFHRHQIKDSTMYRRDDGITLGIKYEAIERAGIYVPGGKASYPSSVLMGVIPAQIAGTKDIAVITPPRKDGTLPEPVCAVCHMLGVDTVIKSGGAQGIAAAGLGTDSVAKRDIIVGPGNIFVTAAKTYLFSLGLIQIDSMAGPSEVLIVADDSANPKWVATDLLSQAEHEEMAIAILVTPSQKLAEAVQREVQQNLDSGEGRADIKKTSIANSGLIVVTDTLEEAMEFSNRYGPEHMEYMVDAPLETFHTLRNIGSLFLGHHAPVAVGDYYSGTNHILPTGGAARFSSGTSVDTFMRRTTFQYLTPQALKKAEEAVSTMAELEGFGDMHGGSIRVRFEE